jgi:preprotein translocase subunit YajC
MGIFLFQMAAFIAIIYFLLIRPKIQQEKRHREQISQIKRGDEVVTAGGIVGEVVHIKDDRLTLKSGESRIVVQRDRIAEVRSAGAVEVAAK